MIHRRSEYNIGRKRKKRKSPAASAYAPAEDSGGMTMRNLKQFFLHKKDNGEEDASLFQLWVEAAEQYASAAAMFSDTADPALIEAAIFDMKAAEARRSFALQQLRASDSSARPGGVLRTDDRRDTE